jgi:Flp pilus assembly protein TadD
MKTTLNLVDQLLALGRNYQAVGRDRDAREVLGRLTGFRELPPAAAEEAQARLAELFLKRRQYARARRCLTAALRHRPDEARYHHLMAVALQADDNGDLERADRHFRRSLELDSKQPKCLGESGLLTVRLGRTDEGLSLLRRAVAEAPADPEALRRLVKGLRLAARPAEARREIRLGLFRNPRDPRFRRLWGEYQYQALRRRQARRPAAAVDDGPVLLPFRRPADAAPSPRRPDGPATAGATRGPRGGRRPDKRQIQ